MTVSGWGSSPRMYLPGATMIQVAGVGSGRAFRIRRVTSRLLFADTGGVAPGSDRSPLVFAPATTPGSGSVRLTTSPRRRLGLPASNDKSCHLGRSPTRRLTLVTSVEVRRVVQAEVEPEGADSSGCTRRNSGDAGRSRGNCRSEDAVPFLSEEPTGCLKVAQGACRPRRTVLGDWTREPTPNAWDASWGSWCPHSPIAFEEQDALVPHRSWTCTLDEYVLHVHLFLIGYREIILLSFVGMNGGIHQCRGRGIAEPRHFGLISEIR